MNHAGRSQHQTNGKAISKQDLFWSILWYHYNENQVIPESFFYEVSKETADINVLRYLPTICKSPNKTDLVSEVLRQCKQKAETVSIIILYFRMLLIRC